MSGRRNAEQKDRKDMDRDAIFTSNKLQKKHCIEFPALSQVYPFCDGNLHFRGNTKNA
jgi:hypothetical protein